MSMFYDNVKFNSMLARRRSTPKVRGIYKIMRGAEVLSRLKELGIETTERTLQRYVKAELIPMPVRTSEGRGKGKSTDYDEKTVMEFYASWMLIHDDRCKLKPEYVSKIRKYALGEAEIPKVDTDDIPELWKNDFFTHLWTKLYGGYYIPL